MRMGTGAFRRVVSLVWDRKAPRPPATLRPGRRMLRPITENLEGRTVLSVGLDPTYGFGGVAQLLVPPNTATTSYYESISSIGLQNGKVVAAGTMTAENSSSDSSSLNVWRLNTDGTLDTSFGSSGTETIPSSSGGVSYTVDSEFSPAIAVQSSGSIDVAAVVTPSTAGGHDEFLVAQLTANGALDSSFGTSGIELFSFGGNLSPSSDRVYHIVGPRA